MQPIRTLSRRVLCEANEFLSVELHEVEFPGGPRIDNWPWVIAPDYVNVVARTMDGCFPVFRQMKTVSWSAIVALALRVLDDGEA